MTMETAADLVIEHHTESPELIRLARVGYVLRTLPEAKRGTVEEILSVHPDPEVRGWMRYNQVRGTLRRRDATEEEKARVRAELDEIAEANPDTLLADTIRGPQFAAENLQVGMTAEM